MMSGFRYGAIGLLCAFYAVVFELARNPTVDLPYRLFYIDKDLRYWPGDPRLRYQPGMIIDLSKASPYRSRRGWSSPEPAGTWMIENRAELFLVPDRVREAGVELRVTASAFVPERYRETNVEVSVNGHPVGRWVFHAGDGFREFRTPIPPEAFRAASVTGDKFTAIAFDVLNPRSPDHSKFSKTSRMLGLHIASVCITLPGGVCVTLE